MEDLAISGRTSFHSAFVAGDEDVEEGEGQNENSGESDEQPPKVRSSKLTNFTTCSRIVQPNLTPQPSNCSHIVLGLHIVCKHSPVWF